MDAEALQLADFVESPEQQGYDRCPNLRAMKSALIWLGLGVLACFLVPYQVRYSRQTVEEQERYAFIPFDLRPFGNEIGSVNSSAGLQGGDQLLTINRRPFTGRTIYAQELRAAQYTNMPLAVTVRARNGEVRDSEAGFAHCTCVIAPRSKIILIHVLPPAFCVLLGFAVALLRHYRVEAWLFLALMLCLSQLTLFPDFRASGLQHMVDVGAWGDWLRVPATAYESFCHASWPAWLVLFSAYFSRKSGRVNPVPTAWLVATPMLLTALAWSVVWVGWSEDFARTASVGDVLIGTSGWATIAAFICAVICVLPYGRNCVAVMALVVLGAITLLYWAWLGLPTYEFVRGSDRALHVVPAVPAGMLARPFVVATFACIAFAVVALANLGTLAKVEVAALLALAVAASFVCVSMSVVDFAALNAFRNPGFPLVAGGLGLAGVAWSILSRTKLARQPGT